MTTCSLSSAAMCSCVQPMRGEVSTARSDWSICRSSSKAHLPNPEAAPMPKTKQAEHKHTKGMSPKHVRKAHVARSTERDAPFFCKSSLEKLRTMSPKSQWRVIEDTDKKLALLRAEAGKNEASAKRKLFANQAGSSAAHVSPGSPKNKKKNNKGERVSPYARSPDGALSPNNPGRDGSSVGKRIAACSPQTKVQKVD